MTLIVGILKCRPPITCSSCGQVAESGRVKDVSVLCHVEEIGEFIAEEYAKIKPALPYGWARFQNNPTDEIVCSICLQKRKVESYDRVQNTVTNDS